MTTILLIVIIISGFYMAWNIGANDVANAMGTSVGSGALSLKQAVIIAGLLEFCGAFFFGSHVSETIESGIVRADLFAGNYLILVYGMLASLLSAGIWLQVASYFGWPVSTTHSIVGSLIGFGTAVGGIHAVYWDNVAYIATAWVISPLLGGLIAFFIFSLLLKKIFYVPNPLLATKRLTPWIIFMVMFTLSLSLVYQGLDNVSIQFSFTQSILISLLVAGVGAVIGYFSVRRIHVQPHKELPHTYDPSLVNKLQRALKHLEYVQARTSGDVGSQLSSLYDNTKDVSQTMQKAVETHVSHTDFSSVERIFGKLQLITACLMAFSHGANDVANAIGPLSAAVTTLLSGQIVANAPVPLWTLGLGGIGIVVGLATWGWRVIYTIGTKLTELTPTRGFAAEFGAAATILFASRLGFPISATHTLVGAVLGVGFARGLAALNLATMRDIVLSWIVTIPAGACLSIVIFYLILGITGV